MLSGVDMINESGDFGAAKRVPLVDDHLIWRCGPDPSVQRLRVAETCGGRCRRMVICAKFPYW